MGKTNRVIVFRVLLFVVALLPSLSFQTSEAQPIVPFQFMLGPAGSTSCINSGFFYDGFCWYQGAANASCTTVCTAAGGTYNDATLYAAGSAGSNGVCQILANNFQPGYVVSNATCTGAGPAVGCRFDSSGLNWRRCTGSTTSAAGTYTNMRRVCACSGNDVYPSSFDFTDVNPATASTVYESSVVPAGYSGAQTASIASGPGQLRTNGAGSWGTAVSISPGDTLNIRMTSSASPGVALTSTVTLARSAISVGTVDWKVTTYDTTCDGMNIGGYCWRLAADNQDCYGACSGYTGCVAAGFSYAYSNCTNLLKAHGVGFGGTSNMSGIMACAASTPGDVATAYSGTSTCSSKASGYRRICPCGTGGAPSIPVPVVYGGYNWRIGASDASCDTACASHGGCVVAGFAAITSSANCTTVVDLMEETRAGSGTGGGATHCGLNSSNNLHWETGTATCAATQAGKRRVCPCGS